MKNLNNTKRAGLLALCLCLILSLSVFAGCSIAKHEDLDKDHKCDDGCGESFGEHADANKDHVCDYGCAESIGKCADVDKNHVCDYGCSKAYGEHIDADKDHVCDGGCREAMGACSDADKDHICDYGCSKPYGEHIDADKDHVCDYGCDAAFGTCEDADKDHDCDYGCDKEFGTHADSDNNHSCDYCNAAIGECADADKDHKCDNGCNEVIGECADADKDHKCDYGCSKAYGECADADKDHKCDYGCSKAYGECADANKDHKCDYGCSKAYGECADANKDHKCDYGCDKAYGECADVNKDHKCDYGCSKAYGECADADKDHKCDYGCSKAYGEHADAEKDHACDYGCKVAIGEHADADKDHACDYGCQEAIGTHEAASGSHNCAYCGAALTSCEDNYNEGVVTTPASCTDKGEMTYTCQICGGTKTEEIAASGHKDENNDYECDTCQTALCTDHQEGEAVVENEKKADCENAGSYDSVVYCTVCGDEIKRETITVAELGHTEETLAAKEPTCTEAGLTEGKRCSVCGEILVAQEIAAAKGHNDSDGDCFCDNGDCDEQFYVLTLVDAVASANSNSTSTVANAFVAGTEITVTADAYKTVDELKYMFVGFDKNTVDNRVGDLGNPKYTFNMPQENFTLTAAYAEANTIFLIDADKGFTISTSANTANWTATKIESSTDADLEGLSGWTLMIPNNAQGSATSTTTNLPARRISTWGLDQNQLIKVIFKNYGNYDLVFEITGEYFKDLWRSGNITVPANDVTVAYMSMGTFLGAAGTTDMGLKLRNSLDGDGSESFQLDVVASAAKQFVARFDENLVSIKDGTYMDFGETSEDADGDGVKESHPIRDGYGAASSSSMTMTNYDSVGAMHFWGDYKTTDANAYARIRGDKLAGEEINLKTIATAGEKLVVYVKVTNLNTIAGKYTLAFTRGSSALSANFIGQQDIVFTGVENESFVYRIEIDPASVGATSTNLQLGLIKKAADGSSGKTSVLVQIASENIFGEITE